METFWMFYRGSDQVIRLELDVNELGAELKAIAIEMARNTYVVEFGEEPPMECCLVPAWVLWQATQGVRI